MATSNDEIFRAIGRLEEGQANNDRRLGEIGGKVDKIDTTLSQLEGGRRMALWMLGAFGAVSGTIGGFAVFVWNKLTG